MKLLIATILLLGAMNSFAACVADGACDTQDECTKLNKDSKKFDFNAADKKCVASKQVELEDCKLANDSMKGKDSPAAATGTSTDGKAGATK